MIKRFGKNLEATGRKIRIHLLPSYRRAFASLLARGLSQHHEGEPIVCCDFSNPAIDAVGGRYYFSLVRDLIDAGYFPVFPARRETLSTFGTSRMKSMLLSERLGVIRSLNELKEPYFLITDRDLAKPALAKKMVVVSYDQRLCEDENEIAFPVFVHPQITSKVKLPPVYQIEETRVARIFFGGNTEQGKYNKDILREVYHMLTRREILEIAAAATPAHRPLDAASWLDSTEFHLFVLCETQHCKIPPDRWLEALGKADFFLACPGVGMPLCHNLIESMAAGCIPILQYATYLTPPLRDGVNCLAFNDAGELRDVIHRALSMSSSEITAMRCSVRSYWEDLLAPGRFSQRLFSGPRTLVINEYRVPR